MTTVVVLEALQGPGRQGRPTPGVPAWARRAVLVACGAAVLGASGTAYASDATMLASPGDRDRTSVAGLPLPDRATGSTTPTSAASAAHAARRPGSRGDVVVKPGDSLWSIAATDLRPGADAAEIAAHSRQLHEHNRAVLGPDPDLIHPGQLIRTLPDPPRPVR